MLSINCKGCESDGCCVDQEIMKVIDDVLSPHIPEIRLSLERGPGGGHKKAVQPEKLEPLVGLLFNLLDREADRIAEKRPAFDQRKDIDP